MLQYFLHFFRPPPSQGFRGGHRSFESVHELCTRTACSNQRCVSTCAWRLGVTRCRRCRPCVSLLQRNATAGERCGKKMCFYLRRNVVFDFFFVLASAPVINRSIDGCWISNENHCKFDEIRMSDSAIACTIRS